MTNPDNVGGLLPCPGCGKSDLDHCPADFVAVNGLTRGMIVRCAWCHFAAPEAAWNRRELCRAAPAGGDPICPECKAPGLLFECVACSHTNYPHGASGDAERFAFLASKAKQDRAHDVFGAGGHWGIGIHSDDGNLTFREAVDAAMQAKEAK